FCREENFAGKNRRQQMAVRNPVMVDPPPTKVDPRVESLEAQVYAKYVSLSFRELVTELVGIIGKKLTAYVASVKDVRTVDHWMTGTEPYKGPDTRLRTAYHVAMLIRSRHKPQVVQSWFMGLNPDLEDR